MEFSVRPYSQIAAIPKGTGMGRRSSHYETIPLCYEHHQGNNSIHNRKREFEAKYGTEQEILQIITERLK